MQLKRGAEPMRGGAAARVPGLTTGLVAGLVLGLSGWGVSAWALSGARQDTETLRVETQLVVVDVIATGPNGPVADFGVDDFRVLDNAIEQEIAFLELHSEADASGEDAVRLPGVRSNRRDWEGRRPRSATVILVDRLNTPTEDQVTLNDLLLDYLESYAGEGRLALYELGERLRIVHDYDEDPSRLPLIASQLEPEHSLALDSSDNFAGFESSLETAGLDRRLDEFLSGGGALGGGRFARESGDYFLETRVIGTLDALETITRRLSGLPGRKNVVWLSGRFPFAFYPHRQTDLANELTESALNRMEQVGHFLTESNVALYPVDVRGPGADGDAYVLGVMRDMAAMTGGRAFSGRTDVAGAINQALADGQVTYSIGFYPRDPETDGTFRPVEIRADRADVQLGYRPGYFAYGGDSESTPDVGLADLLVSPLDATSLGLVASAAALEDNPDAFQLLVLVDIADLALSLSPEGRYTGSLDLVAAFQSADRTTVSILPAEVLPVDLGEQAYQQARQTGFLIYQTLDAGGDAGRIRLVVRDRATGAAGSLWVGAGEPVD
jgi:VWFA-related protein